MTLQIRQLQIRQLQNQITNILIDRLKIHVQCSVLYKTKSWHSTKRCSTEHYRNLYLYTFYYLRASKKSSIITNRKSTMCFPSSRISGKQDQRNCVKWPRVAVTLLVFFATVNHTSYHNVPTCPGTRTRTGINRLVKSRKHALNTASTDDALYGWLRPVQNNSV